MARYEVIVSSHAERAVAKLPLPAKRRVESAIEGLALVQRPPGVEKLSGYRVRYRIRVGDHRVIYDIEDAIVTVVVVDAGHRREIYRDA